MIKTKTHVNRDGKRVVKRRETEVKKFREDETKISPEHRANRKRKINPHTVQNNAKMSYTKMVKNSTAAAWGVT